jgi:hypothetical protein
MADDDNKNDEMMAQFIEKASPKLLEAMTDQIAKLVESQIGGLVKNSTKMLDELQDAKRANAAAAQKSADDATQLKTLLDRKEDPKTVLDLMNPEPITLTRTQARNTILYNKAKEQARTSGTTVQIIADA